MPLQNRVSPFSEIVATPERGTLTGNRGILHDAERRLGRARWRHANWVCCRLDFRGRHRTVMSPGTWTELFFLDEASALAAGHRPCGECRRADYRRYLDAYARAFGARPHAGALDRALHASRVRRDRSQVRHAAPLDALPSGAMVVREGDPDAAWLVHGRSLCRWSFGGYLRAVPRPRGERVVVLTPAVTVAVLAAGYEAAVHPSAASLAAG